MNSAELNKRIADLCDNEAYVVRGLEGTGKCIPYIGWYWRTVDFDRETDSLGDCGDFVGFMERNKWGYSYVAVDKARWAQLKSLLEAVVLEPSSASLQAVFDFMQGLRIAA